jgi:hypothetical protein
MPNPWLAIPLDDYEGHMGPDGVRQSEALSDLFARALDLCKPESVAILGVAGGNGLDRLDCGITKRIVGLDFNPQYLEAVRQRFGALPGLELCCADLAAQPLSLAPVQMVHAALVFEHTGLGPCLENALSLIAPGGKFSAVLQMPSPTEEGVAVTRFQSVQLLRDSFALIDVSQFCRMLDEKGFHLIHQEQRPLPSGKALWLGIFAHRAK